jgi:hypothetical protein
VKFKEKEMALEEMKKELTELVTQIKAAGGEFKLHPPLFKWSYDEHPEIEFQMLIKEKELEADRPLIYTVTH